tara:strand:+ start:798 stop:995 length:198 start_codon:yes stop_codon:yes gene_type:complete
MAKYRGSPCKSGNCGGHKAGASYFRRGGRSLTKSSTSFNNGMRISQKRVKAAGKRTRLSVTKKSK